MHTAPHQVAAVSYRGTGANPRYSPIRESGAQDGLGLAETGPRDKAILCEKGKRHNTRHWMGIEALRHGVRRGGLRSRGGAGAMRGVYR